MAAEPPLEVGSTGAAASGELVRTRDRPLRRVLLVLGVLDITVLVLVVVLAGAQRALGLPAVAVSVLIVLGVATVIGARVALGVRLKRRSGELR
jgi:hypothetical protein